MATTTILHEYERRLDARLARKEISQKTRESYLNDASRICEILLAYVPVAAIQGYMEAAGYQGDYQNVIEQLCDLAREPGRTVFDDFKPKLGRPALRRKRHRDAQNQQTLPGL